MTGQAPGAEGTCLAASGGTGDRYPHSRQAFGEARAAACTCADPGSGRAGPQLNSEASARVQRLEEARRGTYSSSSSSREPLLSRFIDCADQPSWRRAKQACAAAPFAAGLFFNSTTGFYVALVALALFPADRGLPFPSRAGLAAPPAARHDARGLGLSLVRRQPGLRLPRDDAQAAVAPTRLAGRARGGGRM